MIGIIEQVQTTRGYLEVKDISYTVFQDTVIKLLWNSWCASCELSGFYHMQAHIFIDLQGSNSAGESRYCTSHSAGHKFPKKTDAKFGLVLYTL